MNGDSVNSSDRARSSRGSASNGIHIPSSATSPCSTKSGARAIKRRHDEREPESSSVESGDDGNAVGSSKRRQPGVKRACNECRQQKLKCDVITEPVYQPCERCQRLKLMCRIDSNFKRIGKRSRHAQMEKEIEDLKIKLATYESNLAIPNIKQEAGPNKMQGPSLETFMGSEAAASLMDLASGQQAGTFMRSPSARGMMPHRALGDAHIAQEHVNELFQIYFTYYHSFLPILDSSCPPDRFYDHSKLLFWAVISVAARKYPVLPALLDKLAPQLNNLLWEEVKDIPQSYLFVKAICVLCTWPLPCSSTSSDQTYMLAGLNMQIAMGMGLHRPSHVQDFSKFKADLMEDELRDRVRTWASCNAIAQRVSTGYGQPPSTFYDWTLHPLGAYPAGFVLPKDAQNRLIIERFSSSITQAMYQNDSDMVGLASDETRIAFSKMFASRFREVQEQLVQPDPFSFLYLHAAALHFRLSIFFASPTSPDYSAGLLELWHAATNFLETAFNISAMGNNLLMYSSNYVLQMIIASAFTLLKLLNSFFGSCVDMDYGCSLFTRAIKAIRLISVRQNDLPSRFAEVLSQLWRGSGASRNQPPTDLTAQDNSLQLKVRCRMSMSLVFDSVWRWREEFQAKSGTNLEAAVRNPTNPDSNVESSATSVADSNLLSVNGLPGGGGDNISGMTPTPEGFVDNGEGYNEVFDPLNWIFDGLVDFPSYTMPDVPSGL